MHPQQLIAGVVLAGLATLWVLGLRYPTRPVQPERDPDPRAIARVCGETVGTDECELRWYESLGSR